MDKKLGISGYVAEVFQVARITPLLALLIIFVGLAAIYITPKEEEPQINITMANIFVPFPGASSKNVEQMVSIPAEQVLSQISDIEHVTSVSQPGLSIITVQFKVGILRTEALARLHDTVAANADWLPKGLGVMQPIIKPKGIDDVPILTITLFSKTKINVELEKIANNIEIDIKRIKGTKEVTTIGGPGRAIKVELDVLKLAEHGLTIQEIRGALSSANLGMPVGDLLDNDQAIAVESGPFLRNVEDVSNIVLGVRTGTVVFLKDVATVSEGAIQTQRIVYHAQIDPITKQLLEMPAVTLAVTKKLGENAIDIASRVNKVIIGLKQANIIPQDVELLVTRNYGETAADKANKLIQKLLLVTASVIGLVSVALGWRQGFIVGITVILTLFATLFASWCWGFTINRVSLFALIFSIGILVDDAIVVVENIHRHHQLSPEKTLKEIIPIAVGEIGGPTILATLTVIVALLPMKFVSGLMGPYMSPIPINASTGMLLSLIVSFVITPWMCCSWLGVHKDICIFKFDLSGWLSGKFKNIFVLLLNTENGYKNRIKLTIIVLAAIIFSMLLPIFGTVVLKMLPFDNKSEFQVILDMPLGTRVEKTAEVLREIGLELAKLPELLNYQIYAGTAGPINFNGLVRQYYLRQGKAFGDIQVNLVNKKNRVDKSHKIAARIRPVLYKIAKKYYGTLKIVEIPPGPPVMAPIVAEIYGSNNQISLDVTRKVREVFENTEGIVDIDDSIVTESTKKLLVVDRRKASLMGISQQTVINTLRAGLAGENIAYVHDESKYPVAIVIRLPESKQNTLYELLKLTIKNSQRDAIQLSELVQIIDSKREQIIYHKDLLPINYVIADVANKIDSPLYGLLNMRSLINKIKDLFGNNIEEYFINQPLNQYHTASIKWDGEWQITYETFRDLGIAFTVGLILIYFLLVIQFGSYLIPIIVMAPIPLTIIGVMPGHALLQAQFTATSMIGMIALSGIIVRNSILLVDFINIQINQGILLREAIINSVTIRAQPIMLTALAAILGAFFILDDPIFNGLAISLIFGILVSTLLTLIVIPMFYFSIYSHKFK
jgi:multidrug efflux pump subunit AcrB